MRFAYADPPYPGKARRWYADHPDYAGEVDHAELVAQLVREYPDGWAMSTDGPSLRYVLGLSPDDARVAVWHRLNARPPGGERHWWWWDWEPVIVCGGRPSSVRTVFASGLNGRQGRFPGGKPPGFTRWMLHLLGARIEDTIDDLFPGSGAVGQEIEAWRLQPVLPMAERKQSAVMVERRKPGRTARDLRIAKTPDLLSIADKRKDAPCDG